MGIASQACRGRRISSALLATVTLCIGAATLAPSAAWATERPTVTSITPHEVGSAGNFKITIRGTHFEEVTAVHYGTVAATRIITTGTPTKGQCLVKSTTELECVTPFHEHGTGVNIIVTNSAGESTPTAADEITFLFEVYRSEIAVGPLRIPSFGFGQLQIESPQEQATYECASLGDGVGWNEGTPTNGHGEILAWSANAHFPTAEHTELSAKCRFVYHGTEENQPTAPAVWMTTEPPLHEVVQEGEVCAEETKAELSRCPKKVGEPEAERLDEQVIREVSREPSSLPWNVQFTEKSGTPHARIGLPSECKGKSGRERTELEKCPRLSEREAAAGPEGCNIPPTPDPPGCVRLEILSSPPLNEHLTLEGYVEPAQFNGAGNGLESLVARIRRSLEGRTRTSPAGNARDGIRSHGQHQDHRLQRPGTADREVEGPASPEAWRRGRAVRAAPPLVGSGHGGSPFQAATARAPPGA